MVNKKNRSVLDIREMFIKLIKPKMIGDRGACQTEANFTLMLKNNKQFFNISITETDFDGNEIEERI